MRQNLKSARNTKAAPAMLNSWKEIASYLGRGVRTVQRWERENELPVHRIGRGRRSPVCATVPELKFWIATSGLDRMQGPSQVAPNGDGKTATAIENSRRLLLEFRRLVRAVAVTSVRQHQQAEILEKRIQALRSRMR